jgi:hypothetical protein
MMDRRSDSPSEVQPIQNSGSLMTGTLFAGQQEIQSIGPETHIDNRLGIEVSPRDRNIKENKFVISAQDLEQGVRADSPSIVSVSTSNTVSEWITRPRISIIDVDTVGSCTQQWRGWVDDFASSESRTPKSATGCVRIILKEIPGPQLRDYPKSATDTWLKLSNYNIQNRKNITHRRFFSDMLGPSLTAILENGISNGVLQYRAGRKFSMMQLQALLRSEANSSEPESEFVIQTNLHESSFGEGIKPPGDGEDTCPLISDTKRFNRGVYGLSLPFWECLTAVKFALLDDQRVEGKSTLLALCIYHVTDLFLVFCRFPTLPLLTDPTHFALERLSPAQRDFEAILLSTRSALRFSTGDPKLTCRLILLDLMRSAFDGWWAFFQKLSLSLKGELKLAESVGLLQEFENDVAASSAISSTIRDFVACLYFLIESIQAGLEVGSTKNEQHQSISWKSLAAEVKYLAQELLDMAKDLEDRSNRGLSSSVANLNQRQANSARRLTIVASIFLPLTLSASLMAMTTHVNAIGDLWYDWIGLCLVTGTFVLVVYSIWKSVEKATSKRPLRSMRVFIKLTIKEIFRPWGYMLLAVITASFLVGMFYAKRTALDVLKYGVVAVAALAFLMAMMKVLQGIWGLLGYTVAFSQVCWNYHRNGGRLKMLKPLFENDDNISDYFSTDAGKILAKAFASSKRLRLLVAKEEPLEILSLLHMLSPLFDEVLEILQDIAMDSPELEAMLKEILRGSEYPKRQPNRETTEQDEVLTSGPVTGSTNIQVENSQ